MNLQVIRKSRKVQRPGDVFTYTLGDRLYRFGRVMRTDAQWATGGKCLMCYAFLTASKSMDNVPDVREEQLLVAPFFINRLPWSRGYFVTVGNIPFTKEERSRRHYFRQLNGKFTDEYYRPFKGKPKTFSDSGLWSFAYFDYEVSKKLGLPVAENEQTQ